MILDKYTLSGSVAIVTGAGQGIGKAIALAFAELGCKVVCSARTQQDIDETSNQINELYGENRSVAVASDVTQEADRRRLVDAAISAYGRVTHLVNTVGGGRPSSAEDLSFEELNQAFNYNVTSAFHLSQLCFDSMKTEGHGNIINVSSAAAKLIQRNFAAYATVKAGLEHLTRNLAQDLAPHIRVNAIAPGPIATSALERATTVEMRDYMASKTPLQRIGNVDDIASAACFFATDASSWITGQILAVDGGAESPLFNQ